MKKIGEHIYIVIITIASFASHFIFFGYPLQAVFDEVHFGKFISGYLTGEYFFDIHPPLGKLLITAVGILGGSTPGADWSIIGENLSHTNFIWLRLLPTVSGALLPIVIYYLCRSLDFSKTAALLGGFIVILENSLLVQSRFILLDSLLLLFGFGSLLFYFLYRRQRESNKKRRTLFLIGAVTLSAFALSVKWTGVSFFALILGLESMALIRKKISLKNFFVNMFLLFGISFIVYFLSFTVHFALLRKTGPGDAFMSTSFQKTLIGNTHEKNEKIAPLGLFGKFTELNSKMYGANKNLKATHPYSSAWYTWAYMERPIYYWVESQEKAMESSQKTNLKSLDEKQARIGKIYLLGNPFIYWLGSIGVLYLLAYLLFQVFERQENFKKKRGIIFFLLIGFLVNLLPFIFIGRVMFLYHYFSSLIFSIIILAFIADQIKSVKKKAVAVSIIIFISIVTFIFFSPLTYGLPLDESGQEARFWFGIWR